MCPQRPLIAQQPSRSDNDHNPTCHQQGSETHPARLNSRLRRSFAFSVVITSLGLMSVSFADGSDNTLDVVGAGVPPSIDPQCSVVPGNLVSHLVQPVVLHCYASTIPTTVHHAWLVVLEALVNLLDVCITHLHLLHEPLGALFTKSMVWIVTPFTSLWICQGTFFRKVVHEVPEGFGILGRVVASRHRVLFEFCGDLVDTEHSDALFDDHRTGHLPGFVGVRKAIDAIMVQTLVVVVRRRRKHGHAKHEVWLEA
mmetsp:Transcript_6529/g.15974  ORF Transcript_6529/g.15974 Transcript_6529/m.15974 type:complete len:255 (+) Transcript_6529:167-931(+)